MTEYFEIFFGFIHLLSEFKLDLKHLFNLQIIYYQVMQLFTWLFYWLLLLKNYNQQENCTRDYILFMIIYFKNWK